MLVRLSERPVCIMARRAVEAKRSYAEQKLARADPGQRSGSLGTRGMKMTFEGSVRSGPNVWFIRDRGLHWENADG